MTMYTKSRGKWKPVRDTSTDLHPKLDSRTYLLSASMEGLYLQETDNMKLPEKVYGRTPTQCQRILNTFKKRGSNTGVLLSGEKGSGKTLLAKAISIQALKDSIPTIIVSGPEDGLNPFLQSITQPCVVIIDEFEKTFGNGSQQELLTLLDGVFQSQMLFLLTCNDRYKINDNMVNRPGRIFYALSYAGLDDSTIREYCQDHLNRKELIPNILSISKVLGNFSFDQLKALVEEMNRYNETVAEAMEMLNVRPDSNYIETYNVVVKNLDGEPMDSRKTISIRPIQIIKNGIMLDIAPMKEKDKLNLKFNKEVSNVTLRNLPEEDDEDDDREWDLEVQFTPDMLVKQDHENNSYIFKNDRYVVTITKQKKDKSPSWWQEY